jgi:hypothetical protein
MYNLVSLGVMYKSFTSVEAFPATEKCNDHGGIGPISFRRLLDRTDFKVPLDFVDYTVVPPGSTIGRHQHSGNEELYFIAAGSPLVRVNDQEARLARGSLTIVHDGEWHELINDTSDKVEILVIQVHL